MKPRLLALATLVPFAFVIGSFAQGQDKEKGQGAPKGAPASQPTIGVVDLRRVEDSMDPTRLKALMDKEEENLNKENERLRGELNRVKVEMETLDPLSLARLQLVGQGQAIQAQIKFLMTDLKEAHIRNVQAKFFEERYQQILVRLEKLAVEKGLQIVYRLRPTPDQAKEPITRLNFLSERDVLYFHPSLDITDELIKLLKVPDSNAGDPKQADHKQPDPKQADPKQAPAGKEN